MISLMRGTICVGFVLGAANSASRDSMPPSGVSGIYDTQSAAIDAVINAAGSVQK